MTEPTPAAVPELDRAIDGAIIAADTLNEAMMQLDSLGDDWETAAEQLARLRYARGVLQALEGSYESFIGKHGPYGDSEVLGVGVIHVRRAKDRKEWRHEDWQRDVRVKVIEQAEVGETLVDPASGVELNVHELLTAAQSAHGAGAPKVTVLKALGLDAGDYCFTQRGRLTVQIDSQAAIVSAAASKEPAGHPGNEPPD